MLTIRVVLAGAIAAYLTTAVATVGSTSASAAVAPVRIDAGSSTPVTVDGVTWSADAYAVGGQTSRRSTVSGAEGVVASSIRFGMTGYRVPVPNGDYQVRLLMAETYHQAAGKRVFDVAVEGAPVLTSFDIYKAAGGALRPLSRTVTTKVTDGRVDIAFTARVDYPSVSGIAITPVAASTATATSPVALHVDAGASTARRAGGVVWAADRGAVGGAVSARTSVSGSIAPSVYGSIRYGMSGYDLPVPNGTYDVTLRMAETFHKAAGKRVFDVRMEGRTVLSGFDVYKAAGGYAKPVDRTSRVIVTDGRIDVDYTHRVDKATVSAISVVPVPVPAVAPAPATTTTAPAPAPTTTAPAPAPTTTTTAPAPAPTTTAPAPAPTTTAPAPTTTAPAPAPTTTAPAPAPELTGYPFARSSVWASDVSAAPLHPNSAAMTRHLTNSFANPYGGVASLNVWQYNNSYYVAGIEVPRVTVKFNDCQNKGYLPRYWDQLFASVPVPANAVPAVGRDAALSVYSPSTDELYEFWRMEKRTDGWYACWGGKLENVTQGDGIFADNWGSTATGLANSAGMVRLDDVRRGSIDHAVAIAIPDPAHWSTFSWPARRSDGSSTHPDALPEGIRLRLDPTVDIKALNLHPVAEMIALAGQKHGFIVTDKAGTLAVTTESGQAEKARTGTDPWVALLGGTPSYAVLKGIPWDEIEVLPMDYGKPS